MEIRPTEIKDLPLVMEIYDYARAFMRTNGNVTQWIGGYPSEALIRQEIEDGHMRFFSLYSAKVEKPSK